MSIGFGLERLGLLTLKFPRIMAVAVLAFTALCTFQLTKFNIDGDLLRLYRGSGIEYDRYVALNENFGTFENDVYLLARSNNLTDPDILEELRFLGFELELNEFAAGTMSPFSLRRPADGGTSEPAVPEGMETSEKVDAALNDLRANDPLMSNLILADNAGVVMIMFPDPGAAIELGEDAMIASLRDLMAAYQSEDIQLELTGPAIWKEELLKASRFDQLMFMAAGVALGFLTALLSFRTFWGALIATLTPVVTAFWVTGMTILVFGSFTFLTNIISALVLVIAFAESMYFCFYWMRTSNSGLDQRGALAETIRKVSPACALTAITTVIAFASLTLAPGQGLREFAISGALGMALAFLALVTFLPLSLLLAMRLGFRMRKSPAVALTAAIPLVRRIAHAAPRKAALVAILAAGLLLIPHFLLEARFQFQDFLPRGSDAIATSNQIDAGVGGVAPIYIRIPLEGGLTEMTDGDFATVERVHQIAESNFGTGKVISAASFRHYSDLGFSRQRIFDAVGPFLRQRFITEDGMQALITAFSPTSHNAEQTVAVVESMRAELVAAGIQGAEISGFRVLTAYSSLDMIATLQISLVLAVFLSVGLIGIAFRSWKLAFVAIIPNSMPVLLTELFLYASGTHLQLTTVISLTIAFGIAVDDTIHFLAHYARARDRGESIAQAVDTTLDRVGPALIATTLILIAGCAVVTVSVLPQVAMFGFLTVITLISALIGDLIVLPVLLIGGGMILARWSGSKNEISA
ncbi:efflux RND transporter permease subunit [Pelagibacterium sp.]|uniref:efflux RND transporter permease subunit n=1 Tax=Pelagibacterium sp. TaxID=1967288 RepID=UPI003A940191